jgi:pentatricopeptide repeat protein
MKAWMKVVNVAEAVATFEEMKREGCQPDLAT